MSVIIIRADDGYNTAEFEKVYIPLTLEDGREVHRQSSSGIIKEVKKHNTTYVLNKEKIIGMSEKDGNMLLYVEGMKPIKINKEVYDYMIKEISNYGN